MNTVRIDGQDLPYKKTNRAMRRLEKKGVNLTGTTDQISLMIEMAFEFLKEGWMIREKNRTAFPYTVAQIEALDAEAEVSPIEEIITAISTDEKKPNTSTQESGGITTTENIPVEAEVVTSSLRELVTH